MKKTAQRFKSIAPAIALAIAVGVPAFSQAAALPPVSPEGLVLVPNTKMSAVYLREGADFSVYDKVGIIDCYVAFRKNWKRDQNSVNAFRVDDDDIARIKTELAAEFKKVFSETLAAKGMAIVNAADTGVLILRPGIVNLDITAPDTMEAGRTRSFSASAGQMTLYLELYDGVTGELLARVIDTEAAPDYGSIRVRNSITNRSDADRILKKWATALANYFEQVRHGSSAPSR